MNKTRMGKRVASLLLSLVMMLSLLPTAAYATMADGAETQDAIVSGNGTGVSDDSEGSGVTGDQKVEGSNGSNTVGDTAGAEGGADPADSVNGNDSADPQDDGDAVLPAATNVARVGDTEYATLDEAIAALSSSSYTLELLDDTAWDVATPVYWAAGTKSGYAATLADALTAAYMASADAITIVCRPGADVGTLTHGHVADDITIYGNNAYISGGECDLEVDTYTFSRDTGKQVEAGGAYLEKDITVTAYELDNLGVWGQRHTDHKVTVNLTDCDSTDGITVQRVYISGTTGVNDITLTGCDFGTKATSVYSNADGNVVIDNCSFTGAQVPVNFNHKANGTQTVAVQNSTFTNCGDNGDWEQFAAPVRFVNSGSGTMTTTVATCTFTGTVGSNGDILLGDGREGQKSNDVALTVESTEATVQAQQPGYYGSNGTTDASKQGTKNVAAGDKLTTSVTQLMPSETTTYVAEVKGVKYDSLQAAINAAARNATVTMLADTSENVTISTNYLTLDLNGHTLSGGTVAGKPALTVTARVTVKDGSTAQTGTIMREDTAANSGVSSHYVIDVQGAGWLTFESGNVKNNSGNDSGKGASLVRVGDDSVAKYPGLNIKGGTFTQDNFIVIKVNRGDLFLNGGTLNSAHSYAIEDWHRATIKGGTVNGAVAAWTYSGGHNSDLTISGGTVNGNVASVSYDKAEGKLAKVSISGGTVNGTLGTYTYGNGLIPIDDAAKATIEVTGGTFSEAPTKYVVEDSAITPNADGTYGVAKAYLAKVGDTSYYTMDEAFKAQTASGKAIVLLRDYTTGSTFNSGSIARTVDLNGHTWTCTGTDANSAAFEINYPDASLTVKNGKVVSSQLVGLIPSAMGGTIKYDNSSLVFEGVEMTTTAHSGIETNGNNTNDTVTLRNSTLNVPNGFGIYFPSSGTLTIDNSVINAKTMGVQVCAGSLNITGTDTAITVSGDGIDKTINDGAIEDGAAISIVNRAGYKGLDEIKVEGGKFTAKGDNAAVKAYKWENQTASAFDNSKNVVAISGGTFSSEVDKSLCAEGFIPTQNADGTYGVKEGADGYVEDENGNVTISTAEGLFYFAKKANAGNNFAGKTVKLANDIDLNNEKWTPIGSFNDATTQFKGTFDGQNHAVTGLKVEESNKQGVGFFGKVYTGTIKNLTVEGSVSASNCNYVGGIVGHGYATITNCTFKGTVGNNNSMQVGGIAGSGGFTVTNCSVYADVTAECWAGGIVGNCQDGGAYTNCYVEGIISSKSTFWGGGAAGITPVPLYPSQVISGCYSNTVVKVAGEEVNCPIIACYNNPLDHDGYSGGLKIYDNSWNKQKNSNDSYPIYAEKDGKGGVLMEGMTAARDNSLIMLEDDLNYVTGDLSKVRIMAGSSVTQAQIDALAVASVGDSKYKSLTEAIGAAQDGQTVTLLADAAEDVVISKSITLDLGGKTLTNTNVGKATISVQSGTVTVKNGNVVGGNDYYNIEAKKDANLTLTDVTATAGNTGSSMIDNWGTLTITSGTYTGGLNVVKSEEGSVLNISGGTFTLDYAPSSGYTAVILVYGDTTISGGEFIQTATPKWGYPQVVMTGVVEGYTAITRVTGGHFVNKKSGDNIFHGLGKATSDNFKVSGGTFNKSIPESYCADGFIPTKNADGTYGVKEGQYVAQIGSKKYETLADAIRLAAKGKTITLLCDVADCGSLTISKNITLDGGGHTISGNSSISVNMPGNAAADVTIRNVNFKDIANGNKLSAFYFSQVKGKLTITGCTFDSIEYEAIQVTPMEGAEVNVSNNVFKAKADGTQVRHIHIEMAYGSGFDCEGQNIKLTVTDNQLHGAVSGDASMGIWWVGTDSTLKVDGNYMEHPETVSITLANSGVHYNRGDLIYPARSQADVDVDDLMPAVIVAEKASGESKIKAYSTLAEAINAAQAGQTVRLLADVEQNAQLAIDKSITLDLNGKTIKISGYTAEKAQVSVKGNLTIQDSSEAQTGKICSDYTGTAGRVVSVENGGKLTIAGGTITTEGMSGLSGSAVYIASGAEVNMTGGAVKVDAKRGNVAMNVKGSTGVFTMSGGSVIAEAGDGTETYITAISGSSGSTIQISAGTVSGPQALFARSSATTITGGSFTGSITVKNGSISGGTFDRALDKKACAAGYVPTQNEDGTYGVAVGKFTVMVTSRTTGSDSPVANVAGGGSNITYAQGTKVTASAISGYKFVGWFVNEYTGTPYSTDLSCEVKPTADCTMIAVYEPISGGKFWLTVTASEFTVNGGAVQDSYLYEQFAVGASVTVNFTGSENFLYWVNASNKVVSTSKTYTFSMGSATTLKAVYAEKEEHQAMVVFISHTQQVISSKGYTDTQEIQFPEPPIKMGATFVRWSMTEAEIRAAMATTTTGIIVVEPVYEFSAGSYTVTVNYPNDDTATYTATVGKITTVTAKSIDGKVFKCWKNGDTVLGYTETLKIAPRGDLILTAEYVDAGTTVDRLPVIALTEISASQQGAKYAVSFTATRSVPDGYTVTEQGVLVSTDSRYGEAGALDAMKLDADGDEPDNTKSLKATNTDATGVTVLNGIVSAADRTVYGRAYMILRDSSGAMVYVYSDTILSGSYNSLTTNGGN